MADPTPVPKPSLGSLFSGLSGKLPASWKGYLVAAAAGYASSQYGPAAGAAVKCFAAAAGWSAP